MYIKRTFTKTSVKLEEIDDVLLFIQETVHERGNVFELVDVKLTTNINNRNSLVYTIMVIYIER